MVKMKPSKPKSSSTIKKKPVKLHIPVKSAKSVKREPVELFSAPAPRTVGSSQKTQRSPSEAPDPALPSILFEGDPPALREAPPSLQQPSGNDRESAGNFPASVDPPPVPVDSIRLSGKLLLTAQNPNTLFVYGDVEQSSLEQARHQALENKLFIRIYRLENPASPPEESEFPLGTQGLFIPVSGTGSAYSAELGYYTCESPERWVSLLASETASTPELRAPDLAHEDARFGDVLYLVQSAVAKEMPLIEVVQHLHLSGQLKLQELEKLAQLPWPAKQAAILHALNQTAQAWRKPSSLEFLRPLPAPKEFAERVEAPIESEEHPTSPMPVGAPLNGGAAKDRDKKGFSFSVNVEIVVYGSTEPDARVMLAGRQVELSPDGSFSMRYALPDGAYGMDACATSADLSQGSRVHLHFSRATARDGEVGQVAQDPGLSPPG